MSGLDRFFFIGVPYVALVLFFVGTIVKYRSNRFAYSSLSSEFLERNKLFWGSLPFHWGLLVLFAGHLAAFLLPGTILAWNSEPLRLLILEFTGLAFGLAVCWGLIVLVVRRFGSARLRVVTSRMDIVILLLLLVEVVLGLWTAIGFRWGSSWFAAILSPYLWSLFTLKPDIEAVTAVPLVVKLHISIAFLILALIPFTRLVHLLVAPLHYIGRPFQRVIWTWDRRKIRDPESGWTRSQPHNN